MKLSDHELKKVLPIAFTIICDAAKKHSVWFSDVLRDDRRHAVARARNEAIYRMRTELNMGLEQIGEALGGRHHSTIQRGIREFLKKQEESEGSPRDGCETVAVESLKPSTTGLHGYTGTPLRKQEGEAMAVSDISHRKAACNQIVDIAADLGLDATDRLRRA